MLRRRGSSSGQGPARQRSRRALLGASTDIPRSDLAPATSAPRPDRSLTASGRARWPRSAERTIGGRSGLVSRLRLHDRLKACQGPAVFLVFLGLFVLAVPLLVAARRRFDRSGPPWRVRVI